MKKTIIVTAEAAISVSPDTVIMDMSVTGTGNEPSDTTGQAMAKYSKLTDVLRDADIDQKKLKTTGFVLSPRYDYVTDKNGVGQSVFMGYECVINLRLRFENSSELLSAAVSAVNSAELSTMNISYTVRKKKKAEEKLIKKLSRKAEKKANDICTANGVELGRLVRVNYSSPAGCFNSSTSVMPALCEGRAAKADMSAINPEKVEITRSATFVWEMNR